MDLGDALETLEMARPELIGGPTVKTGLTSPLVDVQGALIARQSRRSSSSSSALPPSATTWTARSSSAFMTQPVRPSSDAVRRTHHLVVVEFEARDFRSWVKFSQFGELPEGMAVRAQAGMESYFDSLGNYLAV